MIINKLAEVVEDLTEILVDIEKAARICNELPDNKKYNYEKLAIDRWGYYTWYKAVQKDWYANGGYHCIPDDNGINECRPDLSLDTLQNMV